MSPEYTYFLYYNSSSRQVYPSGDWSVDIARADEDLAFCKDVRLKLSGEIVFYGDDYTFICNADCCDKIELLIRCNGKDYFRGWWSHPLMEKINEDDCTISVKPKTKDKYYLADLEAEIERTFSSLPRIDLTWEEGGIGTNVWANLRGDACLFFEIYEKYGASFIPVGNNVYSTFFENDPLPDGTVWLTNWNYVTGHANKLNHLVLAMAQHIRDETFTPDYPTKSWTQIITTLHNIFNVWWYIDENADVRIEHISFWDLYVDTVFDLTELDGGRWLENKNAYEYLTSELPGSEAWNWNDLSDPANTTTLDFDPGTINYTNDCPPPQPYYSQEIFEYDLSELITDINYVDTNPVAADMDTNVYMVLRCLTAAEAVAEGAVGLPVGTDYVCWYSQGAASGVNNFNHHMSQSNLFANYWMHDRPFWEGTILNLGNTIFASTQKIKMQRRLLFPVCCRELTTIFTYLGENYYKFGVDFAEYITSQYGSGEVYSGRLSPDGMVEIDLVFENDCIAGEETEWADDSQL